MFLDGFMVFLEVLRCMVAQRKKFFFNWVQWTSFLAWVSELLVIFQNT